MEVDGRLRDSKLNAVSVGGLARPDGKIQHGFRGCVQVRPSCRVYILDDLSNNNLNDCNSR